MATLLIEHRITDLQTWLGAFEHQPVDDDEYIYVVLDFASVEQAEEFKRFLEENVWANAEASPALAGKPTARVLAQVTA